MGCSVSNAVLVIQDVFDVSALIAKSILQNMIWDIEMRMEKFWIDWIDGNKVNEQQLRYAQCLIDSAAGNIFFSTTARRYAKHGTNVGN